jgi:hypothetical protein
MRCWTNKKLTALKSGRPLRKPKQPERSAFVAAVPFRVFRNGTGTFTIKANHHPAFALLRCSVSRNYLRNLYRMGEVQSNKDDSMQWMV